MTEAAETLTVGEATTPALGVGLQRRVMLHHGDAVEILRGMPDGHADAVVMDPPYTAAGGSTNGRSGNHNADTQFFRYWMKDVLAEVRRVVKPDGCGFIFCDWRTVNIIAECMSPPGESQRGKAWQASQAVVWDRECFGLGSPFRNGFEMLAFARGPDWKSSMPKNIPNVIRHRWPYGRHENHSAEKPVALCRQLVEWATEPGQTVIDPFMGSGTTGVAAVQAEREFVGIEMEDEHFETAKRRLASASPIEVRTVYRRTLFDAA